MELPHPFDPILGFEIKLATDLLRSSFPNVKLRFKRVDINEPVKRDVTPYIEAERLGKPLPTKPARIVQVLFQRLDAGIYMKAFVDADEKKVLQVEELPKDVQCTLDPEEEIEIEKICLQHSEVIAEIEKMKLQLGQTVCVDPWIYGTDSDTESRRLFQCYMYIMGCDHPATNLYSLPCHFSPVFDGVTHELVRIDYLPKTPDGKLFETQPWKEAKAVEYDHELHGIPERLDVKPLLISQPEGPSFQIEGRLVKWQKWSFRVGFNSREGMILYSVTYDNRNLFYRLSLSEMSVPYGDPRPPYRRKHAFDVGDVGLGANANQLSLGCDCIGHVSYFNGYRSKPDGTALLLENVICLHEQDNGLLHKHTNYRTSTCTAVRNRNLIVQQMCTISNYEYIFAWVFDQAAGIEFEVRATGILSTIPSDNESTQGFPWGTTVGANATATFHQHLFSLRIDPAIDGYSNTVIYEDSVPMPIDPIINPYGIAYTVKETVLSSAGSAETSVETNRSFKIRNDNVINGMSKKPVAYKIYTAPSQMILMSPDSFHAKRGVFTSKPFWVTKYQDDELYAAGEFTNQSRKDTGLSIWADREDNIQNEDVVVWHTFGLTHNPRPEDFPIMPVEIIRVGLKPNGFFEKNPALDVPPSRQSSNKAVLAEPNSHPTVEEFKKAGCCNADKLEKHLEGVTL